MTAGNAERFLAAFRQIEETLRRDEQGRSRRHSFAELVDYSRRPAVAHHRRALKDLAELRNAIVHRATGDGRPIAEPHDDTVALIENLALRIAEPPPALECASRTVIVCRPDDDVAQVARRMRTAGVAQVPVVESGALVGVLSTDTITRWMADALEGGDGHAVLRSRPVAEVLEHAEHPEELAVLAPTASVYEAISAFRQGLDRGRPLGALLVTTSGSRLGRVLGILTPADVPRLLEEAGALG